MVNSFEVRGTPVAVLMAASSFVVPFHVEWFIVSAGLIMIMDSSFPCYKKTSRKSRRQV